MLGVSLDGSCEAKYATLETCSILATVPWACIHTRSLALFFFIIKTLVVSHFLCASRWKPLKMSNETLWFYCDGKRLSCQPVGSVVCCQRYFPGTEPHGDEAVLLPGPTLGTLDGSALHCGTCPIYFFRDGSVFLFCCTERGCAQAGFHAHVSQRETCSHSIILRL